MLERDYFRDYAAHDVLRPAFFYVDEFHRRRKTLPPVDKDAKTWGLDFEGKAPSVLCDSVLYGIYDPDEPLGLRYELLIPEAPGASGYLRMHWPIVYSYHQIPQSPSFQIHGIYAENEGRGYVLSEQVENTRVPSLRKILARTVSRYHLAAIVDTEGMRVDLATQLENAVAVTQSGTSTYRKVLERLKWTTLSHELARELGARNLTEMLRFYALALQGIPGTENEGYI